MRVLVIEDEQLAAKRLKKMVLDLRPNATFLETISRVDKSIIWFADHGETLPDLVFMDIQLADGVSFEIFDAIEVSCPVVFTTAYDEFAIKAIKVNALDYLLKPIKKSELEIAIQRGERNLIKSIDTSQSLKALSEVFKKRYLIRIGKQIKLVKTEDIAFLYTESKLTFAVTFEDKKYPMDQSLEALEDELNPTIFYRANRQYIININAIDQMIRYSKSKIKVTTSPKEPFDLIVSTDKSSNFKSWLAGE